jgi:hypothetical protein
VPPSLADRSRRFIPRWRRMTWALTIFTALMAVTAIAAGLAVAATENISEAEIQTCLQGGSAALSAREPLPHEQSA